MAKKRMQIEEFVTLYMDAAENDVLAEDFAEQHNMKLRTMLVRVRELQKKGLPIPSLRRQSSERAARRSIADRVRDLLATRGVAAVMADEEPVKKKAAKKKEPVVQDADDVLDGIFG